MNFVEVIARKRDGLKLTHRDIEAFVAGTVDGSLPREQIAAFLMAVCWRGMDGEETRWLTEAMLHSGEMWRLAAERPDAVDKHSTGGVGDTASLVLAPLMASAGTPIAMMAGRGLGHSQGTLDKLAAIPGFNTSWERDGVIRLLDRCGAAITAQSEKIAPADRVLYALRDVTGTVESLPLIVSSIMSKKLALGAGTLILDVKWGSGAFRATVEEAVELATALKTVARGMGVAAEAVITDMNQPLGPALGTAVEVREALDVLEGRGSAPLRDVTLRLGEELLVLRGVERGTARQRLISALDGGAARAAWDRIVEAHGGNPDPAALARPVREIPVPAPVAGWIGTVDGKALGWAAVDAGAGRRTVDDTLAFGAGLIVHGRIGDRVERGQPLATLLIGERDVDEAELTTRIRSAFGLVEDPVEAPALILGSVDEVAATLSRKR
ncbi:MAG: thymidine phosphorylase [Acidobacteria bacterium]|nr:thymidine phosphorylase [Acidobacteriota bacterium]